MLRIPGSLNSNQVRFNDKGEIVLAKIPPEAEVRVIQHWDGNRPGIKPLLPQYYIWLQDAVVVRDIDSQMEEVYNVRKKKYRRYNNRRAGAKKRAAPNLENIISIIDDNHTNSNPKFQRFCFSFA
jgi:hypothetical protein